MKMRLALILASMSLASLASLVGGGSAMADPGWVPPYGSAPTDVSSPDTYAVPPQVGTDRRGNVVVMWVQAGSAPDVSEIVAKTKQIGRPWPADTDTVGLHTGTDSPDPQLAVSPAGAAVAVWRSGTSSGVKGAYRPAGGSWTSADGTGDVLDDDADVLDFSPTVAIGDDGTAVAVWRKRSSVPRWGTVQAAVRGPEEESWSAPFNVSGDEDISFTVPMRPRVAVGSSGSVIVVWSQFDEETLGQVVRARAWSEPDGWEAPETLPLADPSHEATAPDVGVDGGGNAVAVWVEKNDGGNYEVFSADRLTGEPPTWSVPPTKLSDDSPMSSRNPQVALAADGVAVAAWEANDGLNDFVYGIVRDADGAWEASSAPVSEPRAAPPPLEHADSPDVAVTESGAGGSAVLVWRRWSTSIASVQVLQRGLGPGTTWQPGGFPVAISDYNGVAGVPQVAIDGGGNTLAVWRNDLDTGLSPETVQARAYDPAGPLLDDLSVPATATTGETVGFSVSATDAWSNVAGVIWDFGDGSPEAGSQPPGYAATHTYASAGTYKVTAKATDDLGSESQIERDIVVTVPAPPPVPGPTPAPAPLPFSPAPASPPAADLPQPPSVSGPAPPNRVAAAVRIWGRAVRMTRGGTARIGVSCKAARAGRCRGTLKLTAKLKRGKRKARTITLGRARLSIPAGRARRIKVRLSRRAVRLVARLKRVRVRAVVRLRGVEGGAGTVTRRITLKASRVKRKRR